MKQTDIVKALAVLGLAALVLIVAVPLLYPYGTFQHLDGYASVMDHDWSRYGAGGWIYALGDFLCHQEQSRSFMLNGSQMPFCIRDVGLLSGLVIGLFASVRIGERMSDRKYLINGLLMIALTLLEWIIENAWSIDLPVSRFLLGIVSGAGVALVLSYVIEKGMTGVSPS